MIALNDENTDGQAAIKFGWLSIATALVTSVMKFGAWHLTGSVGLLSDATESLVNLTAAIMALVALKVAASPADRSHHYGHGKVEYLSSGGEGILIFVAALAIIHASWERFLSPQGVESLNIGLGVALLAGLLNLIVSRILISAGKKYDSITLVADGQHLMTDVWTSVGLVAGLAVMLVRPEWKILDPIIACLMALNIMYTGGKLVYESLSGLMDKSLPQEEIDLVEVAITEGIEGIDFQGTEFCSAVESATNPAGAGKGIVSEWHGLRTRKSGAWRFVELHLLLPPTMTVEQSHYVCCMVERAIGKRLNKCHVTILVEPLGYK
ncbi:MAG: cation diffusion facilitator family transporter [Desulfovibrio sp.]